jgi:AraC-like DNA-binding protein
MDLLQDIFQQAGLKSRFLGYRKINTPMTLKFPCNKSMGFHVVTQGQAYMHLGNRDKPLELSSGDIVFTARGQNHLISTDKVANRKVVSLEDFDAKKNSPAETRLTLVSGAYQVWNDPVHPLFSELPDIFFVKARDTQSFNQIQNMIALLATEASSSHFGCERIQQNILDILFTFIVRKVIEQSSTQAKTWSHALSDEQIKKSIVLMHSKWAKPWTLESLAKELGMSRAGFAVKFKSAMGDTPIQYLTKLRIQKAMELLCHTNESIEKVAFQVGYKDAFGFSKIFKKINGMSPRKFRDKNPRDRGSQGQLPPKN